MIIKENHEGEVPVYATGGTLPVGPVAILEEGCIIPTITVDDIARVFQLPRHILEGRNPMSYEIAEHRRKVFLERLGLYKREGI